MKSSPCPSRSRSARPRGASGVPGRSPGSRWRSNLFLRGWAGYFRIGNSARMFDKIMTHTTDRVCLFLAKRHKRHRRYGWAMLRLSPNRLGLITLEGTVVAPRPNRSWRALVAEHRR